MHPVKPATILITITALLCACASTDLHPPAATSTPPAKEERVFQPIMIETVSYVPGQNENGLFLAAGVDIDTELVITGGYNRLAVRSGNGAVLPAEDGNTAPDSYIQFQVGDGILYQGLPTRRVAVEVEYLDEGADSFSLEYDSSTGAFTPLEKVSKTGSGQIRTAVFLLCDAYFANRTNFADFRILDLGDGPETVFSVTLRLLPTPDDAATIKSDSCTLDPDDNPSESQAQPPNGE